MKQFEPKLDPETKTKEQTHGLSLTLVELLMLPGRWFPHSKTGAHGVVVNHKN